MPELPEVTTTVNGLQKTIARLRIVDVWTDLAKKNQPLKQFQNTIKSEKFFKIFRKEITNKKILNVERRAKNILINIEGGHTILIHLKMTGHLLVGKYNKIVSPLSRKRQLPFAGEQKIMTWVPDKNERKSLHDPYNRFVHVVFSLDIVFSLDNGKHLVFCDSRKFGKVTYAKTEEIHGSIHLKDVGPEPLEIEFDFKTFKERLDKKGSKSIKTVLMDQSVLAGIGNIYSDEMLWLASIHPESKPNKIKDIDLKNLYNDMKKVLTKGIDFGGDSMSDYRNIDGELGRFQHHHNVYQKNKELCGKRGCKGVIIRKVINGRSAHFCNTHQKLYN